MSQILELSPTTWYERNLERAKKQQKEYRDRTKIAKAKYNHNYTIENKDKINKQKREYTSKSEIKQKRKIYSKQYRKINHIKISIQHKPYQQQWERNNKHKRNQKDIRLLQKQAKPFNLNNSQYKQLLQSWSEEIRYRDNDNCQICNEKGKFAHHILFRKFMPELSFILNNGITLCHNCHYELHKLNGY